MIVSVHVHREAIPEELTTSHRWVNWRQVERNGKATKLPVDPITGDPASCSNPTTWGSFDQALVRCEGGGVDGIGFQLGSPFVGIDLDKCRNPETGEVEPWAAKIVRRLGTYAEVSPSSCGIHLLAKGNLPPGARRKGRIEMYGEGRYFTVTGNHLDGTPRTIEERTQALKDLHARIFGERRATGKPPHIPRSDGTVSLTDAELIEKARQAKNGAKFERLWRGDHSEYASQSEADMALCMILAFWTRRAPDRIDILFRQSALFRAKWDERHGANGKSYGQITIHRAIEQSSEVWARRSPGEHHAES
jgi:primase-polymerase (primpol)-like protein